MPCTGSPCTGGSTCAVDGSSVECFCPEGQQCDGLCNADDTGELADGNQTCIGEPLRSRSQTQLLSYVVTLHGMECDPIVSYTNQDRPRHIIQWNPS